MKTEGIRDLEKLIIAVGDLILINLAYLLSFAFRFDFSVPIRNFKPYLAIMPFISIIALFLLIVYNLLSVVRKSRLEIIYSIVLTIIVLLVSSMSLAFLFRGFSFPRTVIFLAAFLQVIFLSVWYMVSWKIQKRRHGMKNIMLIGSKDEGEEAAKKIIQTFAGWFQVKYICLHLNEEEIEKLISKVDLVLICSGVSKGKKETILQICLNNNKETYLVPDLFEILMQRSKIRQFDDIPTLRIDSLHLTIEQRVVKRAFDIFASSVGIILATPIMLGIVIAMRISDPGPVFFSQERVGRDGRTFNIHKFRTMVVNAEKLTGPVLATENDPRITKLGIFMRATRLDEIPQLFNILKGEMSLVGPRPERPYFVDQFVEDIPAYAFRSNVKSGATGLAQVLGKYRTTPEDKLRFDLLYTRNYSFMLDLTIILQTIKILLLKDSSQGTTSEEKFKSMLYNAGCQMYEESGVIRIEKIA